MSSGYTSKGFYGEETGTEQELISALRCCTTANLVGKETIETAVKAGFINQDGVIHIGDVPHAQLFRIFG